MALNRLRNVRVLSNDEKDREEEVFNLLRIAQTFLRGMCGLFILGSVLVLTVLLLYGAFKLAFFVVSKG